MDAYINTGGRCIVRVPRIRDKIVDGEAVQAHTIRSAPVADLVDRTVAALREIVGRIADGILSLITQITSFVMFVTSRDRKSLHDHIAGTVVLYDPNKTLANQG